VKNGYSGNGTQRFYCKMCHKSFLKNYVLRASFVTDKELILLTKEGCGIRSTARILGVSANTVIRRILKMARNIKRPYPILKGKIYQVDELFTFIKDKDKRVCIAYSYEPLTGKIIDFIVGRRNKTNLRKVTEMLILSDAEKIYTDKLKIYKQLIPVEIHSAKNRGINHIERHNLSMRTHLKRLNRKTICYSKSLAMLMAVVKSYFWG
jgi:insertion element IS1 protein InsB